MLHKTTISHADAAALFEVTPKTIGHWGPEGLPMEGKKILLLQAVHWVRDKKWCKDMDDRGRKLKAEADMAEIERDEAQGRLVQASKVQAAWEAQIMRCRARLLNIPVKAAALLVDGMTQPERQAVVERLVLEALAELMVADETAA